MIDLIEEELVVKSLNFSSSSIWYLMNFAEKLVEKLVGSISEEYLKKLHALNLFDLIVKNW
jgi:hypothetical protein